MIAHIVFKDVNPYVYEITDDCRIYKNGEEVPMDDIIYHSTNGYDYVLLEQNHLKNEEPKMKLYRLEFIMVSSFNPGLQNKWEWFKVNHIDGDIKNCKLNNLSWEEDVEEWAELKYPDTIKPNTYEVSTWGRVRNRETNIVLTNIRTNDGYFVINIINEKNKGYREFSPTRVHRLVMESFSPDRESNTIINHIDGDKCNNHVSNLEWVTQSRNVFHSHMLCLQINRTKHNRKTIDSIVKLLNENDGSPYIVYNITRDIYPNISFDDIRRIKRNNIKRMKRRYVPNGLMSKVSTDEVDMVIEMLLDPKYNGSRYKVFNDIDHNMHPNITISVIDKIKNKKNSYIREDSRYDLKSLDFHFKYRLKK